MKKCDILCFDAHVVGMSSGFARVERRLSHIENLGESLETQAACTDQRLESIGEHAARTERHRGTIETHVARADWRLDGSR